MTLSLMANDVGVIKRATEGNNGYFNDDGDWVKGDQSTGAFTIQGMVQPLTGDDIKLLPEAFKSSDTSWLYTTSHVKTVDEYGDKEADTFQDLVGIEYVIQEARPWLFLNLEHYKCLIRKKEKS